MRLFKVCKNSVDRKKQVLPQVATKEHSAVPEGNNLAPIKQGLLAGVVFVDKRAKILRKESDKRRSESRRLIESWKNTEAEGKSKSCLGLLNRSREQLHNHSAVPIKLRYHPMMSYHGVRNWPPTWVSSRRDNKPQGEVGTLKAVLKHQLFPHRIYIVMTFVGWRYMASVTFDNQLFCDKIHALLQEHIGRSIKEIGDLDVSDTL